jgi:uncharacterized protein YcfJ
LFGGKVTRKILIFGAGLVAAVLFIVGNLVFLNAALAASKETIRSASGATIGYIEGTTKQTVYDKNRKIIGYVDENGTYDANRKKILNSKQPGILFCKYVN